MTAQNVLILSPLPSYQTNRFQSKIAGLHRCFGSKPNNYPVNGLN
jgi:hypothetical protein